MARKFSSRASSSTSTKKSRSSGSARSGNAFYGDIMGIAGSLLRSRQEAGAEKISSLANATRNFAVEMTDTPNIQTYVDAAAEQMESLSSYVQDNSMEQMADDAVIFARRHPLTTIAFAIAAGFGFTRLMTHNGMGLRDSKSNTTRRSTRSATTKSTLSKKRAASKAKTNGRGTSHETANVP